MGGNTKGRRALRVIGLILCVGILLCGCLAIFSGAYILHRFSLHVPTDFFRLSAKGIAPRFYVYQFEDRANRLGCSRPISEGYASFPKTDYLSSADIPKQLSDAFIAIEDKRFYQHNGVDLRRTLSASLNWIFGFSDSFGGSTITQQVVKNVTGNDQVTVSRKIQEILYALDLERNMDKSEIMELYLNVIHFSDRCDGIVAAARHYYSKSVGELTLAECASLAAITNSPSYYNPIRHPENNLSRRNLILDEMLSQGMIDHDAHDVAVASPLTLLVSEEESGGINSWYIDMAIEDIIADLEREYGLSRSAASRLVYSGGLRIDLAMDEEIQRTVEEYYRTAISVPTGEDGTHAESALIVLDNKTGDILGVVGSVGQKKGNRVQNFATQTLRPPGSALKPITVYAPALENGTLTWGSVYDDVPVDFGEGGEISWPRNANGRYRGLTTASYAMAHSTNTVAVRILQQLGPEHSFAVARDRFHLSALRRDTAANDCDLAALALGQLNYGITLRELSTAYTVFADQGMYHPCRSYYRVTDSQGNLLLSRPDSSEVVMSEGNAAVMTKLLQGVVTDGSGAEISLRSQIECAGKTGTSNREYDRWFIGYTPELICGVWFGYEYPQPVTKRSCATSVWDDVMTQIVRKKGCTEAFEVPSDVIRVSYCKDSGLLPASACEHDARGSRRELGWFVRGTEPKTTCTCHVLCAYDTQNGGISHGSCPSQDCESVGLIRVERHFPIQVTMDDAQYVYRAPPAELPPVTDENAPYFASILTDFCGISKGKTQFNRSCPYHAEIWEDEDWRFLIPFGSGTRNRS